MLNNHSFEEIRAVALDLIAGRERAGLPINQYQGLLIAVGEVFTRREQPRYQQISTFGGTQPTPSGTELFLEVFCGLFRKVVITLGMNDANRNFPFCRITEFGGKVASDKHAYFFHDVASYENAIRSEISSIDPVTLLYLNEANAGI
jgi:hypothetical protein